MDARHFIKRFCVLSKLSDTPVVARHNTTTLVFVRGYPMTLSGFYSLASKAVFQSQLRLSKKQWEDLHTETKFLCEGLGLELTEGTEAYSIMDAISKAMDWTSQTAKGDKYAALSWIESVADQLISLDQQLQLEV